MIDHRQTAIVRTARNDQDLSRAADIGAQVAQYRVQLLHGGVPEALANQLTFRFNEFVMTERIRVAPAEATKR